MKTEDKFLLSSGISFVLLFIFEILNHNINTDNMKYEMLMKWLDISLVIIVILVISMIISFIGFFISYKIEHGTFPKSSNPNPQKIPENLLNIAIVLSVLVPPIGWAMFGVLFVYYKVRFW